MKTYEITVIEKLVYVYQVKAETKEAAIKAFNEDKDNCELVGIDCLDYSVDRVDEV